jgi:hypothetical protein
MERPLAAGFLECDEIGAARPERRGGQTDEQEERF